MKKTQKRIIQAVLDDIERGEIENAIKMTLNAKLNKLLKTEVTDEVFLARFFFHVEVLAPKSIAKLIATHPARPDGVDDLHKQAEANRVAPDHPERGAEEA